MLKTRGSYQSDQPCTCCLSQQGEERLQVPQVLQLITFNAVSISATHTKPWSCTKHLHFMSSQSMLLFSLNETTLALFFSLPLVLFISEITSHVTATRGTGRFGWPFSTSSCCKKVEGLCYRLTCNMILRHLAILTRNYFKKRINSGPAPVLLWNTVQQVSLTCGSLWDKRSYFQCPQWRVLRQGSHYRWRSENSPDGTTSQGPGGSVKTEMSQE